MRREAAVRVWTLTVLLASAGSGLAFWRAGERVMGGCGLATALLHLVWMFDARRCARACVRRRAIVIPQLRPMVVSPPRQRFAHRLRALWRRHG